MFQIESDAIRQNRTPPDIEYPAPEVIREGAMQAFMSLRDQAKKDFPKGMSMEEIDKEIHAKIPKRFRECHIQPDWLLIYLKENEVLTLTLVATGRHSDLLDLQK